MKATFETSIQLSDKGYNSWFNSMSKLLKFVNLEKLLARSDNEIRGEVATMKSSLREIYDIVLFRERGELFENSKLDFLVSLKENLCMSPYLLKCRK